MHLVVLTGDQEYGLPCNASDAPRDAQRGYAETQYALFRQWYAGWSVAQNLV